MNRKVLVLALLAALAVAMVLAAPAGAHGWCGQKVLFVQTDQPNGNEVMVYDRACDGTLHFKAAYPTHGLGGVAEGAAADPLASQGSLMTARHGRVLLAVNAGSDTVSVFAIKGDRLCLRQVIDSGGDFPASIAVHDKLVYVLNAGGAGSVQGYWLTGCKLHTISGSTRSLGLSNGSPPNFLMSPGQVGFTPFGTRLIVTTKASTSSLLVFRVHHDGRLSQQPGVNPSMTPVPFAFVFDPFGRLVDTEAGTSNVSTYTISGKTLTGIGTVSDGQTAMCWISRARGFYYGSNAGSGTVSSFTVARDGQPSLLAAVAATTEAGTIDSAASADQRYLYVECGAAGTVDAFRVHGDGSLTRIQTVSGIPAPFEGIATVN